MKRGYLAANPAIGTAPKQSRVKQSRPELRFLTERELETVGSREPTATCMSVAVGTGLRFGEVSALWVADVDLDHRTIRVNKAWKRNGENDATDTPGWLVKQLRPKHTMRDHHLGNPKTTKSRRTITIPSSVAGVLARRDEGKEPDDFVFTSGPVPRRRAHVRCGRVGGSGSRAGGVGCAPDRGRHRASRGTR